MPIQPVVTEDGSFTLYDTRVGAHYHSMHGARGESLHVYIHAANVQARIEQAIHSQTPVRILEVGLGTGLNFVLTAEAIQAAIQQVVNSASLPQTPLLHYTAYEPNPIPLALLEAFYEVNPPEKVLLEAISSADGKGEWQRLSWHFNKTEWLPNLEPAASFDVVYYDAFGPGTAPQMWTEEMIVGAFKCLKPGGNLVTFSICGETKRILRRNAIPFKTPKGYGKKREMLILTAP